jgi:hypothetical protein
MVDRLSPHGIKHHIAAHFEKMALLLNQDPFKAPLKQMPDSVVPSIQCLRVNAIQLPHPLGQVPIWRLDYQMIVVIHQTVGMADPVKALGDLKKGSEKQFTVSVVPKNRLAFVAPRSDVVQGPRRIRSVVGEPWNENIGDQR